MMVSMGTGKLWCEAYRRAGPLRCLFVSLMPTTTVNGNLQYKRKRIVANALEYFHE